jgi:integrase
VNAATALLPKQPGKRDRVKHFPSVPWRQLPEVVEQLFSNTRQSTGRQALLFLILTGARSGEVRGAAWQEFDFANQIWTIPAQRMKAGVQHRVPLSTQAIVVLQQRLEFANPLNLAFSNSGKAPISDMTLTKILRDHDIPSDVAGRTATAHGFRSSFRDWASEHQYPRDLAERALAHTIANTTEAAYHRTDLLEQRRQMMQAWADHVVSRIFSK